MGGRPPQADSRCRCTLKTAQAYERQSASGVTPRCGQAVAGKTPKPWERAGGERRNQYGATGFRPFSGRQGNVMRGGAPLGARRRPAMPSGGETDSGCSNPFFFSTPFFSCWVSACRLVAAVRRRRPGPPFSSETSRPLDAVRGHEVRPPLDAVRTTKFVHLLMPVSSGTVTQRVQQATSALHVRTPRSFQYNHRQPPAPSAARCTTSE
jgi:hypothetical protein